MVDIHNLFNLLFYLYFHWTDILNNNMFFWYLFCVIVLKLFSNCFLTYCLSSLVLSVIGWRACCYPPLHAVLNIYNNLSLCDVWHHQLVLKFNNKTFFSPPPQIVKNKGAPMFLVGLFLLTIHLEWHSYRERNRYLLIAFLYLHFLIVMLKNLPKKQTKNIYNINCLDSIPL